jgi:hypothetical protein
MGVLLVVIILVTIGLEWKTFSSGVITGFEKAIDISTPIIKNLIQEVRDYTNNLESKGLFNKHNHQSIFPLFCLSN